MFQTFCWRINMMRVKVCGMDFMGGVETTYSLSDGYTRGLQRMGKPSDTLTTLMTLHNLSSLQDLSQVCVRTEYKST